MSKSRNRKRNVNLIRAAKPAGRGAPITVAILTVAIVAAAAYWWSQRRDADARPAVFQTAKTQATTPPESSTAVTSPAFDKLKGKWLRPDGGYTLDIKSADNPSGKLEVAYLNPHSIHVSKAEASREGQNLKVFVELRDVNYPGSTYTLAYDPPTDQLKGIYYQAALGQQFEVYFERAQ